MIKLYLSYGYGRMFDMTSIALAAVSKRRRIHDNCATRQPTNGTYVNTL